MSQFARSLWDMTLKHCGATAVELIFDGVDDCRMIVPEVVDAVAR